MPAPSHNRLAAAVPPGPARFAPVAVPMLATTIRWLPGILLAVVLALPNSAAAQVYSDGFAEAFEEQPVRGYVDIDALFWTRNMPGAPLMINGVTGQSIISTSQALDLNTGAAPGITFGQSIGDVFGIQGVFFGFYGWDASGISVLGAGNAATADVPFPGLPAIAFDPGDYQTYQYTSDLTNIELNMTADLTDGFTFLWGFRYLNLDENFRGTLYENTNALFGGYNIQTQNNLVGFQIGGDQTFFLTDSWTLSLLGKVGIFGNAADQRTVGSFLPGARTGADGRASVVAQLGLQTAVQLSRNIAIRGGYQALFVDNVALAPSQMTVSNWAGGGAGGISTSGELLAHGGNIGFEITW
jgi:hypothetical protein